MDFGLVGRQARELSPEAQRLVTQIRASPLRSRCRGVALVEDDVDHREDRCQPRRALLAFRHLERHARRRDRLLRRGRSAARRSLSGWRYARAISAVERPPTSRSVSAARDTIGSTGWHATNIIRSRSSSISPSSTSASGAVSIVSGASCWYLALNVRSRRNRSTAFRFATAINHAPGFRGSPSRGHCTIASVSASCARSSARLTSSTWRARPATRRGNSMRNTVSIARVVASGGGSPVTARDSTRVTPDRTPAAPGPRPRRAPRGTASTTRPPRRGRGTPSTPIRR